MSATAGLQVPSGLITSISGGGLTSGTAGPLFSYPIPVVIVGANGASASGNHSITDTSGILNVAINSGIAVSISGDVILVVSGGTVQVSGVVTTIGSGATVVQTSGTTGSVIVAGSGGISLIMINAGQGDGANMVAGTNALSVANEAWIFNGVTTDRSRSTQGVSGIALGILATGLFWQYKMVSGATASGGFIINVTSGPTALHTITPITTTALGFVNVLDATSGNVGALVANYSGVIAPVTFTYDAILTSGLQVVVLSGASFAATVTYRNPA